MSTPANWHNSFVAIARLNESPLPVEHAHSAPRLQVQVASSVAPRKVEGPKHDAGLLRDKQKLREREPMWLASVVILGNSSTPEVMHYVLVGNKMFV